MTFIFVEPSYIEIPYIQDPKTYHARGILARWADDGGRCE